MGAHLLYQDFFRFLDALPSRPADPWQVYEEVYLDPNRAVLQAWWDQCIGQPGAVWRDRVRNLRPQDYDLLREIVRDEDPAAIARDVMGRCQALLPLSPEPDVYFLVGFFSPEGLTLQVRGTWAIAIGMERMGNLRLLPIILAHEYGHCYRRSLYRPAALGERLVDEGFAIELSARAFPDRPAHDHLLMRAGQLAALRQYESRLWSAVGPLLDSEDEGLAARIIYGRGASRDWPSRAGMYLGWRSVQAFLEAEPSGFGAPAARVLETRRTRRTP